MIDPIILTVTERAILANQFNILARLDDDKEKEYLYRAEALEKGYERFYGGVIGIEDKTISYELGEEVLDIMSMFRSIDRSLEKIPCNEKASLDSSTITFKGFSGNDETPYFAIVNYLINTGAYPEYKDAVNSHFPSLPVYRRMFEYYKKLPHDDTFNRTLNKDQIQSLIDATKHVD